MSVSVNAEVGCRMVGEFVDEAAVAAEVAYSAEVVPTNVLARFVDVWGSSDGMTDFTVLLRDNRMITVRGQGLKYLPSSEGSAEQGSYAVLAPAAGGEITVALFNVSDVMGIFSGSIGHS